MSDIHIIEFEHARSKSRISKFGEVFTPESHVNKMLDILPHRVWSDERVSFFEPTCGHGNFVTAILSRRIDSLTKLYTRRGSSEPLRMAIATALDSIWAVDVCSKNINDTRRRSLNLVFQKIIDGGEGAGEFQVETLAHLVCMVNWHIHENEVLSSLKSEGVQYQTTLGQRWLKKNGEREIDFENTWRNFFHSHSVSKRKVKTFERAVDLVSSILSGGERRGYEDLGFAKDPLKNFVDVSFGRIMRPSELN